MLQSLHSGLHSLCRYSGFCCRYHRDFQANACYHSSTFNLWNLEGTVFFQRFLFIQSILYGFFCFFFFYFCNRFLGKVFFFHQFLRGHSRIQLGRSLFQTVHNHSGLGNGLCLGLLELHLLRFIQSRLSCSTSFFPVRHYFFNGNLAPNRSFSFSALGYDKADLTVMSFRQVFLEVQLQSLVQLFIFFCFFFRIYRKFVFLNLKEGEILYQAFDGFHILINLSRLRSLHNLFDILFDFRLKVYGIVLIRRNLHFRNLNGLVQNFTASKFFSGTNLCDTILLLLNLTVFVLLRLVQWMIKHL